MKELLKITISEAQDHLMIKEIMFDQYQFSRKSLIKIKNNGGIYLNGQKSFATMRVNSGDILQIFIEDEDSEDILPMEIPIDIIYEDKDILIINKQPYLVVHPTRNYYTNTLANGLIYYWQSIGESHRFRPVNRLDKDTSGLLIIAKSQYAHHKLSLQIQNKTFRRTYHAIVHGVLKNDYGTITTPIIKDPNHGVKRLISDSDPSAKSAVTHYKVITRFEENTLVELNLGTGRTHQIRVHMSSIHHPLVGDDLYGGQITLLMERQALHAIRLDFKHPINEKELTVEVPYPEDFQQFLSSIS